MTNSANIFGDRYEIEDRLSGGVAVVTRARDTVTGRKVAIKTPMEGVVADPKELDRFVDEARRLCNLDNENIVTAYYFYEVGELDNNCHLVMEWMDKTLEEVMEAGDALEPGTVIEYIRQILCGVRYIHAQGLIHRDLKPMNVFLSEDGKVLKIGDLGIAGTIGAGATVMGTFQYLAPELGYADVEPDERIDIYALGLIFYELFCGREKFQSFFPDIFSEPSEQVRQVRWMNWHLDSNLSLEPLSSACPGFSEEISTIIARMTAKNRQDRYRDIDEVYSAFACAEDANRFVDNTVQPIRIEEPEVESKGIPTAYVIAGVVALVLATVAYLFLPVLTGPDLTDQDVIALNEERERARDAAIRELAEKYADELLANGDNQYQSAKIAYEAEDLARAVQDIEQSIQYYRQAEAKAVQWRKGPREFQQGSTEAEIADALALCEQYTNGCKKEWYSTELAKTISLKPYVIDRYEVTQAEFAAFVAATGYVTEAEKLGYAYIWNGKQSVRSDGAHWNSGSNPVTVDSLQKFPVTHIGYEDAVAYCEWANARLPSEAEWEFAARGHARSIYPWGDRWDPQNANWQRDGRPATVPVGSIAAVASGQEAFDMAGNVWEWVQLDPDQGGQGGALKGGSYLESNPANIRSAARRDSVDDVVSSDDGFRCVRDAEEWPEAMLTAAGA